MSKTWPRFEDIFRYLLWQTCCSKWFSCTYERKTTCTTWLSFVLRFDNKTRKQQICLRYVSRLYPGLQLLTLKNSQFFRDFDWILDWPASIKRKMNISSEPDPLLRSYLQIFDELNLTHLITDLDNTTELHSILEDNFIWPPDMRWH